MDTQLKLPCVLLALATFACGSSSSSIGPGEEGGAHDATASEGGPTDATSMTDTGADDDASLEGGSPDGGSPDGSTDAGIEAGPAALPYDWMGVIGTGQSLSVGATAGVISTTQPFHNLKLVDTGPDPKYPIEPDAGTPKWATTPLTELIRGQSAGTGPGYSDQQYPNDIQGETPHSGMADTLTALWKARGGQGEYVSAHTVVGWSGHCLSDIDKEGGMRAYPASINETRVFNTLAKAAGKTYGVGGLVLTHGECDSGNSSYGTGLYQFIQDYETDIKAITKQTQPPVLFISQQSTIAAGYDSSAVQVWQAGVAHPQEIVCTGPKYQYQYNPGDLHFPAPGYERLGEKYAQVFDIVVNRHSAWAPLQPTSAKLAGAEITLAFQVPVPPMNWDNNIPLAHQTTNTAWKAGKGFEVVDASKAPVEIASVAIQGSNVVITLAATPAAGTKLTVGYALTQDGSGTLGGTAMGLVGQLRDSDTFVAWDAEDLPANVTNGSAVVTSTSSGAFVRRTGYDDVTGASLAAGTIVVTQNSNDQLTLSAPWTGATGMTTLSFHHDQHNYCVHFAMPVQ